MSVSATLAIGGTPVPDALYNALNRLEVEESSDRPGALLLQLPVNRTSSGDLQFVGDGTFEPGANITLTATPSASGSHAQCIFDGYVLSWRLHLDRASTSSTIEVWAQDASWLMNIDDQVAEWKGHTDGEVANMIFGNYGFATADGNTLNDSPGTQRTATRCSSARRTCSSCVAWPGAAASCAGSPAQTPRGPGPGIS